jgi:hypothetical protein
MKISKIFAGMSALAIAGSMLAMVPASADEEASKAAFSGSKTMSDSAWWTEAVLSVSDLIGDVDPSTVDSIVFKADTNFTFGYNSNEVTDATTGSCWKQVNDSEFTISGSDIDFVTEADGGNFYAMFGLSKADSVDYTISWDVYTKDASDASTGDTTEDNAKVTGGIYYADGDWYPSDWSSTFDVHNGDNSFTIYMKDLTEQDGSPSKSSDGLVILTIDLLDCFKEQPDLQVELTGITLDGVDFAFDASKILYGNIEDNTDNYRMEIYNIYGETVNDPGVDLSTFNFTEEMTINFKVSGLKAVEADNTTSEPDDTTSKPDESGANGGSGDTAGTTTGDDSKDTSGDSSNSSSSSSSSSSTTSKASTSTSTTTNPNTGAAALAAVGVALAGAAVVASKKRK